jgi:hypothetical protein
VCDSSTSDAPRSSAGRLNYCLAHTQKAYLAGWGQPKESKVLEGAGLGVLEDPGSAECTISTLVGPWYRLA